MNAMDRMSICILALVCTAFLFPAYAAKVYKRVDANGDVYFTDKPETVEEAVEQSEERKIENYNRARGYKGKNGLTKKKRNDIIAQYEAAKKSLEDFEEEILNKCGEKPNHGFIGFGEKRDRVLGYDKCYEEYKPLVKQKKRELRAAEREYVQVK